MPYKRLGERQPQEYCACGAPVLRKKGRCLDCKEKAEIAHHRLRDEKRKASRRAATQQQGPEPE